MLLLGIDQRARQLIVSLLEQKGDVAPGTPGVNAAGEGPRLVRSAYTAGSFNLPCMTIRVFAVGAS